MASKRLQAYVATALWSSTDNDEPMDHHYDISHIHPDSLAKMEIEILRFFTVLDNVKIEDKSLLDIALEYQNEDQICHDLWLTRNRHGAGFWDGDYGEYGDRLTTIAHFLSECDLYVGNDGMIHLA